VASVNHLAYGWINPVMAYAFSFLGSLLALLLAKRARDSRDGKRLRLLLIAALVLGSTGIWLMHFVAILGFDVPGLVLRYDLFVTALSLAIAVGIVGFGLLVVGLGEQLAAWRFLFGGPITGIGVAAMHYVGMAAININAVISYDRLLFVASVIIAMVAATVALWLAMVVKSASATVVAAAAMGVAVCSMHYTGMAAVEVHPTETIHPLHGSTPFTLLVPISLLASILIFGFFYAMAGMSIRDQATALPAPQPLPGDRQELGPWAPPTTEPPPSRRLRSRPGSGHFS
jgi:NO-binding membrane sensor protein with MHYT domain